MPKRNVRIEIPGDPSEVIALLGKVKTKHEALGAASPLAGLEWDNIGPAYERALVQDGKADESRKIAETATGERNKDMPAVTEALRSARDVLAGIYRANPKKLTEFGFEVNDSPHDNGSTANTPQPVVATK
jgi:hypothetical protein